jgi:hypothetical protein
MASGNHQINTDNDARVQFSLRAFFAIAPRLFYSYACMCADRLNSRGHRAIINQRRPPSFGGVEAVPKHRARCVQHLSVRLIVVIEWVVVMAVVMMVIMVDGSEKVWEKQSYERVH